jgi:Fe-S-cluster-containing dehydrogenase component
MKRIYVIEDLCNGCRLCQSMCSSLANGVFSDRARIKVLKAPGEELDIPIVSCDGRCVRCIYDDGVPTCVSLCPTGALIYATQSEAVELRLKYESARKVYSILKVVAPWKWPLPYNLPVQQLAQTEEDG